MERWKGIVGAGVSYHVSNWGNIRSLDRILIGKNGVSQRKKGQIMVSRINPVTGYYEFKLNISGNLMAKKVHRVVAEAFIPKNGEDKVCVNHKNGNKLDNRVENLEWVSYSENLKHSYDVLNRPVNRTTIKYRNVICTFPNDEVVEVKSIDEASRLTGVSSTQIRRLHGNGKKSRNGYSFYIPSLNVEDSKRIVI